MTTAAQAAPQLGPVATCAALGVSRASLHRLQNPPPQPPEPIQRPSPPRALTAEERSVVLAHLHSERFQDRSPIEVYGTLLDEGVYCCSARTMYRLLNKEGETRERRDQLTHPPYQKPELLATAPNQLWSWDTLACVPHHQAAGACQVDVFLRHVRKRICTSSSTFSAVMSWDALTHASVDAGRSRRQRTGQTVYR